MGNCKATSRSQHRLDTDSKTQGLQDESQKKIDLMQLDDFTEDYYKQLLKKKNISASKKFSSKNACIHSLVSENRMRYTDQEFNLDLAYITKRIIAMGFPAQGVRKIYRNPLEHVLEFFNKHHSNNVKVYNLCDDAFIDTNQLQFSDTNISIGYFPMMDHNPGSVKLLFHLVMDIALYLTQNESNVAAIHCKAGKGRTGVGISAYLIFMEACTDAYEAVEFFNTRRTKDGKGLSVASQKRYLHYFDKFLKSNFKSPFLQLLSPYIRNPQCFDNLFIPKNRLKLMTICIGPFTKPPTNYILQVQLRSFEKSNLFKKGSKKRKVSDYYIQYIIYNSIIKEYHILIIFNEEIVISEDIRIRLKNAKLNTTQKLQFHYWLNAKFLLEGVGKVSSTPLVNRDKLNFSNFITQVPTKRKNYEYRIYEDFKLISSTADLFSKNLEQITTERDTTATTGTDFKRSKSENKIQRSITKSLNLNQNASLSSQSILEDLTKYLIGSINKYEQNGLKKIKVQKDVQQMKNHIQSKQNNSQQKKIQGNDHGNYNEDEMQNDAKIMQRNNQLTQITQELFSESEDEMCIVKDDDEEGMNVSQKAYGGGSFRFSSQQVQEQKSQIIKPMNNLQINPVSSRKKIPNFNSPFKEIAPFIQSSKINEDSRVSDNDETEERKSYPISGSNLKASDIRLQELNNSISNSQSQQTLIHQNGQLNSHQLLHNPLDPGLRQSQDFESAISQVQPHEYSNSLFVLNNNPLMNSLYTASFNEDDNESRHINISEIDISQNMRGNKSPQYSASDENERYESSRLFGSRGGLNEFEMKKVMNRDLHNQVAKNKASLDISERINELSISHQGSRRGMQQSLLNNGSNQQTYLSNNNLSRLQAFSHSSQASLRQFRTPGIGGMSSGSIQSSKEMRKLVHVQLSCEELDKFKQKKLLPDIKVTTTFYCDPALDSAIMSYISTQNSQNRRNKQ